MLHIGFGQEVQSTLCLETTEIIWVGRMKVPTVKFGQDILVNNPSTWKSLMMTSDHDLLNVIQKKAPLVMQYNTMLVYWNSGVLEIEESQLLTY